MVLILTTLKETATVVEDQLDSDGNEIIYDLSRPKNGIIEFYRGISLAIDRMDAL